MKALLELDCVPVGMEVFPARGESSADYIRNVIDECDYFIMLIGGAMAQFQAVVELVLRINRTGTEL